MSAAPTQPVRRVFCALWVQDFYDRRPREGGGPATLLCFTCRSRETGHSSVEKRRRPWRRTHHWHPVSRRRIRHGGRRQDRLLQKAKPSRKSRSTETVNPKLAEAAVPWGCGASGTGCATAASCGQEARPSGAPQPQGTAAQPEASASCSRHPLPFQRKPCGERSLGGNSAHTRANADVFCPIGRTGVDKGWDNGRPAATRAPSQTKPTPT